MKSLILFVLIGSLIPTSHAGETLHSGTFSKKSQKIAGSYTIVKIDNRRVIQFDAAFKTKKGPDLQLILTPITFEQVNGENAVSKGTVSLGALISHKGAQEFTIPEHVDLHKMKALLVHCVKYSKLWGGAPLN